MLGAAIMLAITYPSGDTNVAAQAVSDMPTIEPSAPDIEWTFFEELPKAEVRTGIEPVEYVLHAAQFLRHHDAQRLRGALILDGMSASISPSPRAGGGSWHRVLVGPYETEGDAQAALNQLRARDLPAQILLRPLSPSTTPTT